MNKFRKALVKSTYGRKAAAELVTSVLANTGESKIVDQNGYPTLHYKLVSAFEKVMSIT